MSSRAEWLERQQVSRNGYPPLQGHERTALHAVNLGGTTEHDFVLVGTNVMLFLHWAQKLFRRRSGIK